MNPVEIISLVRSGVVQISLEINRERKGFGSAFLVKGGIVTNSHVIRERDFDAINFRFADTDPDNPENYIRFLKEDIINFVASESYKDEKDYVYIHLSELEFDERYVFELENSSNMSVGEQVVFLGYPFGMNYLTSHIGYISSIHKNDDIKIIQIDGSINGGNSGGPLLDLKTGKVVGIITRAVTGLIEDQFNNLINALRTNQEILGKTTSRGGMMIMGIDPLDATQKSFAIMERIARDLRRSANVGIGYAYAADHIIEGISEVKNPN